MKPSQGEIWPCDLEPHERTEAGGVRSVMVLSCDSFNEGSHDLVVVVPIQRATHPNPLNVPLAFQDGSTSDLVLMPHHLRSVGRHRLQGPAPINHATNLTLQQVTKRVLSIFGIIL